MELRLVLVMACHRVHGTCALLAVVAAAVTGEAVADGLETNMTGTGTAQAKASKSEQGPEGQLPSAPVVKKESKRSRRVMAWMGTTLRTDAELDASIAYFASHRDVINTVSPETHSLGDNGTLVERLLAPGAAHTPTSIIRALKAAGLMVIPQIYDERAWNTTAILPRFERLAADPAQFIADAVALAVKENLDGWNIDFELTDEDWANISRVTADGQLLVEFVDRFARALHAEGKVLSVDVGTCCHWWWDAVALNASSLDRVVDMSTYKGASV